MVLLSQELIREGKVRLGKYALPKQGAEKRHRHLIAFLLFKPFRCHFITFEYFPDTQPTFEPTMTAFQPLTAVAT